MYKTLDKLKRFRVKSIRKSEYQKMEAQYLCAKKILDDCSEFTSLLSETKTSLEEKILNNTIQSEATEGLVDGVKKIFTRTRQENIDYIAGQYHLAKTLKETLDSWIDNFESIEAQIKAKQLEVYE